MTSMNSVCANLHIHTRKKGHLTGCFLLNKQHLILIDRAPSKEGRDLFELEKMDDRIDTLRCNFCLRHLRRGTSSRCRHRRCW